MSVIRGEFHNSRWHNLHADAHRQNVSDRGSRAQDRCRWQSFHRLRGALTRELDCVTVRHYISADLERSSHPECRLPIHRSLHLESLE